MPVDNSELLRSLGIDMQRTGGHSTRANSCCACMWKILFCFRSSRESRNRRATPVVHQYRAPEIGACSTASTSHELDEDVRAQERGQLLPKDAHASAPTASSSSVTESKGESSGMGMKNLRHNRGKGSKGSGSFLEDIMNAAGGLVKGGSSNMLEDDDICPTCLDPYTGDNPKIWTRCGHHFHMPCIFEWMERKDTCPMCESPMVLVDGEDEELEGSTP